MQLQGIHNRLSTEPSVLSAATCNPPDLSFGYVPFEPHHVGIVRTPAAVDEGCISYSHLWRSKESIKLPLQLTHSRKYWPLFRVGADVGGPTVSAELERSGRLEAGQPP